MANFAYNTRVVSNNLRDVEYGIKEENVDEWERDITEEDKEKKKIMIKDEVSDARQKIIGDINSAIDISKEERKSIKKIFSKRLDRIMVNFENKVAEVEAGDSYLSLDDIDEELEEALTKTRDLADEMVDNMDCRNEYCGKSYGKSPSYGSYGSIYDYEEEKWTKRGSSAGYREYGSFDKYEYSEKKNYADRMKEVKSERELTLKFDADSFNSFLSESDGKLENIAVITSDNREYEQIEDTVFKIQLIPKEQKLRQGAYTEADGKEIADALAKVNGTKCGWIHTHPFGKGATFFSGTDDTTTKEMCVLPNDYCIAVVVACAYNEVSNSMKSNGRVIKEYELSFDLGKMVYRKVEVPKYEYDPESDKLKQSSELLMSKYRCNVVLVDKDGNEIEMDKPDPKKYDTDSVKAIENFDMKSYEKEAFLC